MANEITKFEQFFALAAERLEQAGTTDEVIAIREQAMFLAAAARAAKSQEYEEKAAIVKQQAERRLGVIMASQRDAGIMSKGGRPAKNRGNENPGLQNFGIDKNLAKAARKAYPEGWPKKPARRRMTPNELASANFSLRTERYRTEDGGSASRIKLMHDELVQLRARVIELETENARLASDLDALQTGQFMKMSQAALLQRRELAAKLKAKHEERKAVETLPDQKTTEAFERQIKTLKVQLRTEKSKVLAFSAGGKTVLNKDDRKAILVCLHPDGALGAIEKERREKAFKLFSSAIPEPGF